MCILNEKILKLFVNTTTKSAANIRPRMLTNRIITITLHCRPKLTSPYVKKIRLDRPSFILLHLEFSDVRPNNVTFTVRIITTT